MSERSEDARRSWARFQRWLESADPDADAALDALGELGRLRRELDEGELSAVRAARRGGRSWTEIATRLGVSRQAAWEKWREVDDTPPPYRSDSDDRVGTGWSDDAPPSEVSARVTPRAIARVRRGTTRLPDVVGHAYRTACKILTDLGLEPEATASTPPAGAATVVRQYPESGVRLPPGTTVRLWTEDGGAGVREPRRPHPTLRSDAVEPDQQHAE